VRIPRLLFFCVALVAQQRLLNGVQYSRHDDREEVAQNGKKLLDVIRGIAKNSGVYAHY
jgi:hypothetical protein